MFATFLRRYLESKLSILESFDPDEEDVKEDEHQKHVDDVESAFVEVRLELAKREFDGKLHGIGTLQQLDGPS